MRTLQKITLLVMVSLIPLGCVFTPGGGSLTPTPAGPPYWTPGAGACQIVATGPVDIFKRPGAGSTVFSHLAAGDRQDVAALTADGWAGFDPGIPQAPNIPPFRNRWVQLGGNAHLEGACGSMPVVMAPQAGVCFVMIWDDKPVYASADASSAVLATMHQNDYAALLEVSGDWARVNLGVGNLGLAVEGWVQQYFEINTDGACAALGTPAVTPAAWTPSAGACQIVATGPVDIFKRPGAGSTLFSHLAAGDRQDVAALTADGWAGFDPGIPQAPNIPAFRNRWVQLGGNAHLEGECAGVPVVEAPPPGVCFVMIWDDKPVYESADASAAVLATLHMNDYAALLEVSGDWARVDLGVGSLGLPVQGWVQQYFEINTDGACAALGTPTDTPTPDDGAYYPDYTPGPGACEIVATGPVTIYNRPSLLSDVFSSFSAGDRYAAMAYTADGFIGFDPAYAQAGNVGVFRLRWVPLGGNAHLEGACGSLPLVVGPAPNVCFAMAYEDLSVYAGPDAGSAVVATMQFEDYAQILETSADWVRVDLSVGNLGLPVQGWVSTGSVGMNGPCEGVPTSTPAATETPAAFTFFPKVTPDHIYALGSSCGPKEIQFYLTVSDPAVVRRVDIYYRLKNKANLELTEWKGTSMNPTSGGGYLFKLLADEIEGALSIKEAWLHYMFVAVGDKVNGKEVVIARSEVYYDVDFSLCGKPRSPNDTQ